MTLPPAEAAFLLAAAVSVHNLEEAVWLPRFPHPKWLPLAPSAFAFRFAAAVVALAFWALAGALAAGLALHAVLAGLALVMIFNAIVPHLALTLALRRYHPGLATAWLAVVPAAVAAIGATGAPDQLSDSAFRWTALAAIAALALSLPLLMAVARGLEKR